MTEFEILKKFFASAITHRSDVLCGIGDDTAVVATLGNKEIAITMDTLVEGVHFPKNTPAYDVGYKTLAVNLSDLAAMGAIPSWIMLSLTLPNADYAWLERFSEGFFTLAHQYNTQLIGGDLTQGPLSATVTAFGYVATKEALLRSRAQPGDLIYVTGTLGDAALALIDLTTSFNITEEERAILQKKLNRPEPRILLGQQLRGIAHAAIDISDGLASDLKHILVQSQVGAEIDVSKLPLSNIMRKVASAKDAINIALTGGDDYELCFTLPSSQEKDFIEKLANFPIPMTCIGRITSNPTLIFLDHHGQVYQPEVNGYEHFKTT